MITKLSVVGDGLGIGIEQPLLDVLGVDEQTPLEVLTDGEQIVIRRAAGARTQRLRTATLRLMDAHDETLKKLAR